MIKHLLTELRHRKVIKTTLGYVVLVATVVEFTSILAPLFSLPDSLMRNLIILGLMGIPLVIALSWFFDLTAGGVKVGTASEIKPKARNNSHFVSIILIALLASTVVYLSYRLYWESTEKAAFQRGKSIAVMPFTSISAKDEPDTAYFSLGVSEEILNALSKVDGLRVAASTSSFLVSQFDVKEVGKALDVSVLLLGSVRRDKDQLRISAQLIDTKNGFQLWSDVYDHSIDDVFDIQEKIAKAIVDSLQIKLLGDKPLQLVKTGTKNLQAYDKYLEGRDELKGRTSENARKAIKIFEQAIEIDPDYAQAYSGLADSWILLREVGNISLFKATQNSHDAITKSLQLDNTLPEAQASLGLCILGGESYSQAARQFQKAIELDPEYSHGYFLRANLLRDQGFLAEATKVYTQAISLDPLNLSVLENQALLFAYQGRYEKAIEQLNYVAIRSADRVSNALFQSQAYSLSGNFGKALEYSKNAVNLQPNSPIPLSSLLDSYVRMGKNEQADIIYQTIKDYAANNETAIIAMMQYYLLTGDYKKLEEIASSRLQGFLDNDGFKGSQIVFKRVGWAARAHLALGQNKKAKDLLEKGLPEIVKILPQPDSIHTMIMLVRAHYLEGNETGALALANDVSKLLDRAQLEGMNIQQLAYARVCLAASLNQPLKAVSLLKKAINVGWKDFVKSNHDPVLLDVVKRVEYKNLINNLK